MPLNDLPNMEKASKHSTIMSILPATTTAVKSVDSKVNKNMPEMQELMTTRIASSTNLQGQKWTYMLDFERVFKQIRQLEKTRGRNKNGNNSTNNGISNVSVSSKLKRKQSELRQVQRLEDSEMHFYGKAPKQSSKDLIICDVCTGIFNIPGFSDHTITQHSSMWTKITGQNLEVPFAYSDNSHDGIRNEVYNVNSEVLGSPSDLSCTMSTCSTDASSGSTACSATNYVGALTTSTQQKVNSKTGSSSESSITNTTRRARSKSKTTSSLKRRSSKKTSCNNNSDDKRSNPNTNQSPSNATLTMINKETSEAKRKSKSSTIAVDSLAINNSNANKIVANNSKSFIENPLHTTGTLFASSASSSVPLLSSTSSVSANSSYSLAPTPKIQLNTNACISEGTAANGTEVSSVPESSYSLMNNSSGSKMNELHNKIKKKNKNTGNYDSLENGPSCSSNEELVLLQQAQPMSERPQLSQYQMAELDQAVSSITDIKDSLATTSNSIDSLTPNEEMSQTCNIDDGNVTNNPADASAMLKHVLEEMLDSNFINEILNAESDINFDVNDLNENTTNQTQDVCTPDFNVEPMAKRMRFDSDLLNTHRTQQMQQFQQTAEVTHDYSREYNIFPAQQQHQQPYNQYQTSTVPVENSYQQTPTNTIDAMQLQQLLYQQQHQRQQQEQTHQLETTTVYDEINMNTLNMSNASQQQQHHTQSNLYDANGTLIDTTTKHIIELCRNAVSNTINDDGVSTKFSQDEYIGIQDQSAQFQMYNVPSLTDDNLDSPDVNAATHHIVERQYVVPSNEEHLIYEITSNNPVVVYSQQHQGQVITEILNQAATYEHHRNAEQQPLHNDELSNCSKSSLYYDDLFDFDFSLVETVKSLGNGINNSDLVTKMECPQQQASNVYTYHEDFYYNVFHYAGVPRPLAINSFGLIKLPQGVASTLRKHLLTTRKLSNSLVTLGGSNGMNGIVGQSSTVTSAGATVASRLNNSKQLPNYFTTLGGANEFSIGSITITNTTANNSGITQTPQANSSNSLQQPQQKVVNPCYQDINWSNNINSSGTLSLGTSMARGRHKIASNTIHHVGLSTSGIANSLKHKFYSGLPTAVQVSVGTVGAQKTKTIIVSNAAALSAERNMKIIKRNFISKVEPTKSLNTFSNKKVEDILAGKKNTPNNESTSSDNVLAETSVNGPSKILRFYERRRKLIKMIRQRQNSIRVAPYYTKQLVVVPAQHYHQNHKRHLKNYAAEHVNGHIPSSLTNSSDVNLMRVFM